MTSDEILMDTEERMEKAVNVFRDELRGPAHWPGHSRSRGQSPRRILWLADTAEADAQINCPEPQQIVIRPFDSSQLKEIEKAIRSSDLGMSPNNDGKMIRLTVPPMSGEQRQKMVKRIKESAESCRVSCRNVRRDGNKHFDTGEKNGDMTEDERDKGKEDVQALLKQYEDKINDMADKKTKEITEQ